MLYAVVMRFNSLRKIETSALTFVNKMPYLMLSKISKRSVLGDANKKRDEAIFGNIYLRLLMNNFNMNVDEVIAIYFRRRKIELFFLIN